MRYELKVLFHDFEYQKAENLLASIQGIHEIFCERQINNIYLDTPTFADYLANIHGADERKKFRIRWYGNMQGIVENPSLELKYKRGILGGKEMMRVPIFSFNHHFRWQDYAKEMDILFLKQHTARISYEDVRGRAPSLVNTYKRKYYISADKRCRFTLDRDMVFYSFQNATSFTSRLGGTCLPHTLMEIKFEEADFQNGMRLINSLGIRIYKNSKYINGINTIYGINTF